MNRRLRYLLIKRGYKEIKTNTFENEYITLDIKENNYSIYIHLNLEKTDTLDIFKIRQELLTIEYKWLRKVLDKYYG